MYYQKVYLCVTKPIKLNTMKNLQIKKIKLTDLPDRAFAVGMPMEKYEYLKSKIQNQGFIQPIIIDKQTGNILDGQSRLMIADSIGIKEVPAIYMNNPVRTELNKKIKELESI